MGMLCSSHKHALLAFGASFVFVSSMLTNEASVAFAFVTPFPSRSSPKRMVVLMRTETDDECSDPNNNSIVARRSVLQSAAMVAAATLSTPLASHALVKGNAPPSKSSPPGSSPEKKCRNVEECQEQAERLAQQKLEEEMANATPPKVAPGGSRYKDIVEVGAGGSSEGEEGSTGSGIRVAKAGETVELRYKVLKLGKRSYDGLSGEGTVVFSRGEYMNGSIVSWKAVWMNVENEDSSHSDILSLASPKSANSHLPVANSVSNTKSFSSCI